MSMVVGIGQMGVQTQKQVWKLLCKEHDIELDGTLLTEKENMGFLLHFTEQRSGKYVPHAVACDLESTTIDELMAGSMKNLWREGSLIGGNESAANNYARGKFQGSEVRERCLQQMYRCSEYQNRLCDMTKMSALSGGTGSGFAAVLFDSARAFFKKVIKQSFQLLPSNTLSTNVVAPYNAMFGVSEHKHFFDLVYNFDNEGLYRPCAKGGIKDPCYADLNQLLAQLYNGITHARSFESVIDSTPLHYLHNLVPFPLLNQAIANWGPVFENSEQGRRAALSCLCAADGTSTTDTLRALQACIGSGTDWISVNSNAEQYVSCCLNFRGPANICDTVTSIKKLHNLYELKFVPWSPNPYKIGLSRFPSKFFDDSRWAYDNKYVTCTRCANNIAIKHSFEKIATDFDVLFLKKSFVHHFERLGVEREVFEEGRESFSQLVDIYELISNDGDFNFMDYDEESFE